MYLFYVYVYVHLYDVHNLHTCYVYLSRVHLAGAASSQDAFRGPRHTCSQEPGVHVPPLPLSDLTLPGRRSPGQSARRPRRLMLGAKGNRHEAPAGKTSHSEML